MTHQPSAHTYISYTAYLWKLNFQLSFCKSLTASDIVQKLTHVITESNLRNVPNPRPESTFDRSIELKQFQKSSFLINLYFLTCSLLGKWAKLIILECLTVVLAIGRSNFQVIYETANGTVAGMYCLKQQEEKLIIF